MRSIEPFAILFAWYAPGFVAARAMARRGHDPLPWVYAAWIGGALTVIAALVWARVAAPQHHHPTARRNA